MNILKFKIGIVALAASVLIPVAVSGQTAKRELHYWGSPDNYLGAQGMVFLDLVDSILDDYPPTTEKSIERKQALHLLDAVLHETKYDGSELVKEFAVSRTEKVVADFAKPLPDGVVKVYKIYNDGFLLRSSKLTVAADLTGRFGKLIPDEVMSKVVDLCDILFLTHNHSDHCDDNVVAMFTAAGKPVYAVADYRTSDPGVSLIRWEEPKGLKLKVAGQKLKVKVFPGHQDQLPNNLYVIEMPGGVSAAILGDQYNKDDMVWIKEIQSETGGPVDILMLNCWSNDYLDYLAAFAPKLIVSGHEDELGHSIDHREAFWLTYHKLEEVYKVQTPYVIMAWGEGFVYAPSR